MNTKKMLNLLTVLLLNLGSASAATLYVWQDSPSPGPPYTTWAAAAHIIQDAVDAAAAGDEIVVTNGVYASGGRAARESLISRVAVDKPVVLRSVNGPEVTIIEGAKATGGGNGEGAIRCVYLANNALLDGFTLTNGATHAGREWKRERVGGGVRCESMSAVVTNCILIGNSAGSVGGGVSGGVLQSCLLQNNSATWGGGVSDCTLDDCTLTRNSAVDAGGGAVASILNNSTVINNTAIWGGGVSGSTANNCVITRNSGTWGGGVSGGTANNCTVTRNSAAYGGGASGATMFNCIVYYNRGGSRPEANHRSSALIHCCTTPLPTVSVGNIDSAPLFVDTDQWNDLSLLPISPCIDAGDNAHVTTRVDLGGNPRIMNGIVDMGAYEFAPPTPAESVEQLIKLVNDSDLQQKQPLLASLEAALASIERGNHNSAIGQLHAFQNTVEAQVSLIDSTFAMELIEGADAVVAVLSTPPALSRTVSGLFYGATVTVINSGGATYDTTFNTATPGVDHLVVLFTNFYRFVEPDTGVSFIAELVVQGGGGLLHSSWSPTFSYGIDSGDNDANALDRPGEFIRFTVGRIIQTAGPAAERIAFDGFTRISLYFAGGRSDAGALTDGASDVWTFDGGLRGQGHSSDDSLYTWFDFAGHNHVRVDVSGSLPYTLVAESRPSSIPGDNRWRVDDIAGHFTITLGGTDDYTRTRGPNSHFYQVLIAPGMDWNTANSVAQATKFCQNSGHLVTITSEEENEFVESIRKLAVAEIQGGDEFLIGGFQGANEPARATGWQWVNGEGPIAGTNGGPTYANWMRDEPNDYPSSVEDNQENFLGIGLLQPGQWNDEGDFGNVTGYIIEWDVAIDATVVIDGCDSGVPNLVLQQDGHCTISDLIDLCAVDAENHGQFVSGVATITSQLVKTGLISGVEKGRIQSCAAEATTDFSFSAAAEEQGPKAAGRLHSLKRHPNGKMQMKVSGAIEEVCIVQASTNLIGWEAIGIVAVGHDGSFEFEDPDAGEHQCRFYRVVMP